MSQVVIGTAGHIDHGKTALVQALTGTNTDRLAEEQARGMTIDLGFAFLTDNITIIDVPGHERFVRNMVSGVSTIQIGLFVIAADDGIMPQTVEHLQILSLLNIQQGVIALTKTDLADSDWVSLVEEDVRHLCKGTFLEEAPIVHTSITDGSGIEELRSILQEKAQNVQDKVDRGFFRLQVDRSFSKTGFGIVVTGTVISGELKKGDEIHILPNGKTARVRGLQSHGKTVDAVKLGDRAAVNLTGLNKVNLWRGVELVGKGWLIPTKLIIANISMVSKTKWKIKSKQRIRIHIGTQEILGRIYLQKNSLKEGESTNALIQIENLAVAAMDDRFVIRSYSPMDTIGGGLVLDPDPRGYGKSRMNWIENLKINQEKRYLQFIDRESNFPRTLEEWCKIFHVSKKVFKSFISRNELKTAQGKPFIYSGVGLSQCQSLITKYLEDFHQNQPNQKFMKTEELRAKSRLDSNWFEFVLSELIGQSRVKQIQNGHALADYNIELSDRDQIEANLINRLIDSFKYEPVTINLLTEESKLPSKKILELLHVLKDQGKLINIADGMWSSDPKVKEMVADLKQHFMNNETLSVVQFKNITGLTRKSAIPLLEYFDRQKITVRDGNDRVKGDSL